MTKLEYKFTNDILFKMLFVQNPDLLQRLVAQLLGIQLESIDQFEIRNPEMPPEDAKFCLECGERINAPPKSEVMTPPAASAAPDTNNKAVSEPQRETQSKSEPETQTAPSERQRILPATIQEKTQKSRKRTFWAVAGFVVILVVIALMVSIFSPPFIIIDGALYATSQTRLDLSGKDLQDDDIKSLRHMTSLTQLNLSNNQISDLSPLSELTDLTVLKLNDNQINNLSPLSGLWRLTELRLSRNQINNLSPLSRLGNLTLLELSDNQISDKSGLPGNLTRLDLSYNQISNTQGLPGKLTWLDLSYNQISSFHRMPLNTSRPGAMIMGTWLPYLTELYLRGNQISDISPLNGWSALEILDLRDNQIADFSPLENLPGLTVVYIDGNPGV